MPRKIRGNGKNGYQLAGSNKTLSRDIPNLRFIKGEVEIISAGGEF